MAEAIVTLEYGARRGWLRRRWKRTLLLGILVIVAMGLWIWREDITVAVKKAQLLRAQQKCLDFKNDPTRVVYEEDGKKVSALLLQPDYLAPYVNYFGEKYPAVWLPREIRDYPIATANPITNAFSVNTISLCFLHERTTPGGQRVLVCAFGWIEPTPGGQFPALFRFKVSAFHPATWQTPPRVAGGLWAVVDNIWNYYPHTPVRLYGGRLDPSDSSIFTIDYELTDNRGRITPSPTTRGVIQVRIKDAPKPLTSNLTVEVDIQTRPGDPRR